MEYRDYYATLGVPRDASPADIKKHFRKLARTHHPDVNKDAPEAEARFKELNEAYDVLSDPEKRKLYDQLGADWDTYQGGAPAWRRPVRRLPGRAGGGVRFEYRGDPQDLSGFSDFFRTFFAGDVGARRPRAAVTHSPDDPLRRQRTLASRTCSGGMGGGGRRSKACTSTTAMDRARPARPAPCPAPRHTPR